MKHTIPKLVRWYSDRNSNDGRRDSAIGVNTSKWHIVLAHEFTVCGRIIGKWEHYSEDESYQGKAILVSDCCKNCVKNKFKI